GFNRKPFGGCELGKRRAALDLIEEFVCLGAQAICDLLLMPAPLELWLYVLERAIARRYNVDNVVPDVTAIHLQRIDLDAELGRERACQHTLPLGNIGHLVARPVATGATDLDRADGELELLGRFG